MMGPRSVGRGLWRGAPGAFGEEGAIRARYGLVRDKVRNGLDLCKETFGTGLLLHV